MKHLLTFFIIGMIGLLSVNISYSQAVDDRAVVPVSVTLNSILRLNVESGGNVEFNFNTLDQYENGISGIQGSGSGDDRYSTKITVASSVNWDLRMGAEDDGLVSSDTAGAVASMDLSYITFQTEYTSNELGVDVELAIPSSYESGAETPLEQITSAADLISNRAGSDGNAGDVDQNAFRIDWACGTPGTGAGNLMGSDLTGSRYSTNVFFILEPASN